MGVACGFSEEIDLRRDSEGHELDLPDGHASVHQGMWRAAKCVAVDVWVLLLYCASSLNVACHCRAGSLLESSARGACFTVPWVTMPTSSSMCVSQFRVRVAVPVQCCLLTPPAPSPTDAFAGPHPWWLEPGGVWPQLRRGRCDVVVPAAAP